MLKYILYAIASGLLLTLGWPSNGFPILLFFGFVPLLFAENKIAQIKGLRFKSWRIFGLSYLAFFIWNAAVIWWLHYAQEVNAQGELVNSWTAYMVPVFANSLMMSVVFQLYHWVKSKSGHMYGIPFLPAIWMAFEKFHLNWEMSWPWFNLGNGFANFPQWVQWYEYTGSFGGSLWILLGNMIVFYYLYAYLNLKKKAYRNKLIVFASLWVLLPIGISYAIYYNYEEKGEEITALILQPELDSYTEKYEKDTFEILDDLIQITHKNMAPEVDFVVAPETAFPGSGPGLNMDLLTQDYLVQILQKEFSPYPKMSFVSGVELMRYYPYESLASATASRYRNSDTWYDVANSAIQLNAVDSIQVYHKSKLVVGVEHFPYASFFKPLIGDMMLDFGGTISSRMTQKDRSVFVNSMNEAKVAPIICYESIYGEFVTEYVKKGANVLFVMTNDSWWGNSDGHRQLLLYGNLRAIENRRDIVRSANSGISAFVNQKGEVTSSLPYETNGALLGKAKLNNQLTFYSQHGDYLVRFALLIAGVLLGYTVAWHIINRLQKKKKLK